MPSMLRYLQKHLEVSEYSISAPECVPKSQAKAKTCSGAILYKPIPNASHVTLACSRTLGHRCQLLGSVTAIEGPCSLCSYQKSRNFLPRLQSSTGCNKSTSSPRVADSVTLQLACSPYMNQAAEQHQLLGNGRATSSASRLPENHTKTSYSDERQKEVGTMCGRVPNSRASSRASALAMLARAKLFRYLRRQGEKARRL